VANVSQLVALDKALLRDRVGKLARARLGSVLSGIDAALGR
jgi:mRNA-degrading endonuclease toxin of MazEF toxin-antitoxin module